MRSYVTSMLVAICTTACSSSSSPAVLTDDGGADASAAEASTAEDSSVADAATNDSSPVDAATVDDAAAACNALTNVAPSTPITQLAGVPPTAHGGALVDGTYALTNFTIYTGAGGASGVSGSTQTTVQIAGSTFNVVTTGTPATQTSTVVTSGTSLTSTETCPGTDVIEAEYTATSGSFTVYIDESTADSGTRTAAETFTLQ